MTRNRPWFRMLALALCAVLLFPVSSYAAGAGEEKKGLTLTVTVPETHLVTLEIGEHGAVKLDGRSYSGTQTVSVARLKEQVYQIVPSGGYLLDTIMYNGESVLEQVKASSYTAPAIYEDGMVLKVTFKKNNNTPIQPLPTPSEPAPSTPFVTDDTGGFLSGWDAILAKIRAAEEKTTLTVELNGTTELPGRVLEAYQGRDIEVRFKLDNKVIWSIHGKDLEAGKIQDMDLGVSLHTGNIPEELLKELTDTVTGKYTQMPLKLSCDQAFGFSAELTFQLGSENGKRYASLFRYSKAAEPVDAAETTAETTAEATAEATVETTAITETAQAGETASSDGSLLYQSTAQIQEDGTASFPFVQGTDYVIIIADQAVDGTDPDQPEIIKVTKVKLDQTALTLTEGKTASLKASVKPADATNQKVKWKSSDTSIARVSSSGKITAVNAGTATITCTAADGSGKKATCKLTVKRNITSQQKLAPKVTTYSNKIRLQWSKVDGADGYLIYGAKYGEKLKKLATVKTGSPLSWTHTGLTKGATYRYAIKAYQKTGQTTKIVATSVSLHAATTGGSLTNAKKVTTTFTSVTLSKGKMKQIKASIQKIENDKTLVKKAAEFRYCTSNKKVAAVSKNGKITAVGAGKCYIYVYANNGASRRITVTVK